MLEQIHPSATKAKDDRYYDMEPEVRNLATRKNYMAFWEKGMYVKNFTLNQSGKVIEIWYQGFSIFSMNSVFLRLGEILKFLDILKYKYNPKIQSKCKKSIM